MTTTATKSRPILFSGPMARAIDDGRKTQTRRVVKFAQPNECNGYWPSIIDGLPALIVDGNRRNDRPLSCPYGQPGDELWVREEHYRYGHWEPVPVVKTKTGRQKWQFVGDSDEVRFECLPNLSRSKGARPGWYTRVARFMPRWASRITLTVKAVRVERLQDISEADARAEGSYLGKCACLPPGKKTAIDALFRQTGCHVHGAEFKHLWRSINGPGSWAANPWVWVVEFERKVVG